MSQLRATSLSLLDDIRACSICADLPLGPKPLFQVHPRARILVVGQAPGRKTHLAGRPFDDVSGDRLRAWLGMERAQFYDSENLAMVPMGFCYPGTGKGGDLPPRPECAPAWRSQVLDVLSHVELTLIIGRYAINWHLPTHAKRSVTDIAKDWAQFWPKALVLPHPSPRNNRWLRQNPWFEADVVPMLQTRVATLLG